MVWESRPFDGFYAPHSYWNGIRNLYGCKSVLMVKLEGLHVVTGAFEEWAKEKSNDLVKSIVMILRQENM